MTFTIDLPPETVARLQEKATAQGLDAAEYARRVLEADLPAPSPTEDVRRMIGQALSEELQAKPRTGAEAIAYWKQKGVLGLFADRPPTAEFARELRRQVWTRATDADSSEQDAA